MTPTLTTPIPVIIGPTASGKSALAVEVALRLRVEHGSVTGGEVVTADAFQIYHGMDIGTAKPTPEERRGVPHHVIDVVDPHGGEPGSDGAYTVSDWLADAWRAIEDVRARGGTPIVCGGTSLYIQSLLRGLFEGPPADEALRAQLHALPAAELRRELERTDPAAAERIHPNDLRRTVRAIEVHRLTGRPISAWQTQWERQEDGNRHPASGIRPERDDGSSSTNAECRVPSASFSPFRIFVLTWEVEALNRRINARVKLMMVDGLLDEVRGLRERGALNPQAREALGYKQLLAHLDDPKGLPLEDAVEKIKIETRRFGKNQRTWMKRLALGGVAIPGELPTAQAADVVLSALRRERTETGASPNR